MKLIVKAADWYCNLPVTEVKREDELIFAYKDDALVGIFDVGGIVALWVSEEKENR